MIIGNVRGSYERLQRLEAYKLRKKFATVESAVEDVDRVRFPMCVMALTDFFELGHLVPHETARAMGKLHFLDTTEVVKALAERIIFISHQWTSFGHPDHSG